MTSTPQADHDQVATKAPVSVEFEEAVKAFDEMWHNIAQRAYELFEGRGCLDGQGLGDWLTAQNEILSQNPLQVADEGDRLLVRTEAHGFKNDDLRVFVQPHRLLVKGHSGETSLLETESSGSEGAINYDSSLRQIYRSSRLPSEGDVATASATLKDGVLEVVLAKRKPGEKSTVEV